MIKLITFKDDTMKLLLVRHGKRERKKGGNDRDSPLSDEGRYDVQKLVEVLAQCNVRADLYLTSSYAHACETGDLLLQSDKTGSNLPVLPLKALTPHSPTETFEEILNEVVKAKLDVGKHKVIAIIGHEPRLSQLPVRLTSSRSRPFARAEVVCLQAPSLTDFIKGKGQIAFRYPVNDFQESPLRDKVASKMSISTFLAGFTSTALLLILTPTTPFPALSQFRVIAGLSLTGSLVLFISAVYMYDRLSMPERFWAGLDRRGRFNIRRGKAFDTDLKLNGQLYALMVWTWKWVFTPAVLLALVGFLAFLLDIGNMTLITGFIFILTAGISYYWSARPRLGTD